MAIHDNLVIAETNNNAGKIMLDYDNAEKLFSSDVKDTSKTYTAPKDGVALVYANLTGTDAVVGNILDVRVLYLKDVGSSTSEGKYSQHVGMVFMKKGDVLTFSECSSNAYIIANNTKFIPYKEETPNSSYPSYPSNSYGATDIVFVTKEESLQVEANVETNIEISPNTMEGYEVMGGFWASLYSSNSIKHITKAFPYAKGTSYPVAIRVLSSVAQKITISVCYLYKKV